MIDFFNNREWAIIIWAVIALGVCLFNKGIKDSILVVLKSFFVVKIVIPFLLLLMYVSLFVFLIYQTSFWNASILKDSIIWFLIASFALIYRAINADKDKKTFVKLIAENLTIGAILEYAISLYPFSFSFELVLQPLIVVLTAFFVVVETKNEYMIVKKIFGALLFILTIFVLWHSIENTIINLQTIPWRSLFAGLLLPTYLTVVSLPFVYLLFLYSKYEQGKIMKLIGQ